MAKDLIRTRHQIEKFYKLKSQLQGVALRIQVLCVHLSPKPDVYLSLTFIFIKADTITSENYFYKFLDYNY